MWPNFFPRACAEGENGSDFFHHVVGWTILGSLVISYLATICLQWLGDYYNFYRFTKIFSCRSTTKSVQGIFSPNSLLYPTNQSVISDEFRSGLVRQGSQFPLKKFLVSINGKLHFQVIPPKNVPAVVIRSFTHHCFKTTLKFLR